MRAPRDAEECRRRVRRRARDGTHERSDERGAHARVKVWMTARTSERKSEARATTMMMIMSAKKGDGLKYA